jgi:hypothetical protein
MQKLGFVNGNQVWRSEDKQRYFTWDALHGEIEVFDKKGRHLGAADPITGKLIKPPVRGRSIDV